MLTLIYRAAALSSCQNLLTMKFIKLIFLPIFLAGSWIGLSEFIRNDFFLKDFWSNHYEGLGVTFPYEPINAAVWSIWSYLFAVIIYVISKKFDLLQTFILSWSFGFLMMWLVIWNLGALPGGLLYYAIPLSILEVLIAAWIVKWFENRGERSKV